jgi:hypothetical protein
MNGDQSARRVVSVQRAFGRIADCVQEVVDSKVRVDEDALSTALGSIGARLMLAAQLGPEWEQREFDHWARHAHNITQGLIESGKSKGAITREEVMTLFKKAPGPE